MSYLTEILKPINRDVYSAHREIFDDTRELILFSDIVIDTLQKAEIKAESLKAFEIFIGYCFFRTTEHGISLWLLASAGKRIDASIIFRAVSEITIKFHYVIQDDGTKKQELAQDYLEYNLFEYKKGYEKALKICLKRNNKSMAADFEKRIGELKSQIGDRKKKDYWATRRIIDLACEIGMEDYYQHVFAFYSDVIHFNPRQIKEYFNQDKLRWTLRPSTEKLDQVLVAFYDSYLQILKAVADTFIKHPFKKFGEFENKLKYYMNVEG